MLNNNKGLINYDPVLLFVVCRLCYCFLNSYLLLFLGKHYFIQEIQEGIRKIFKEWKRFLPEEEFESSVWKCYYVPHIQSISSTINISTGLLTISL